MDWGLGLGSGFRVQGLGRWVWGCLQHMRLPLGALSHGRGGATAGRVESKGARSTCSSRRRGWAHAGEENKALWLAHDATELVGQYKGPPLPMLIDTGGDPHHAAAAASRTRCPSCFVQPGTSRGRQGCCCCVAQLHCEQPP